MAGIDYRSCDICGTKTFYDANLDYDMDANPPHGLQRLGDWKVLCVECAKNWKVQIVKKKTGKVFKPKESP